MATTPDPPRVGRRLIVVAAGPIAGVAAGGLTNLLTTSWNWWLFGGLVALACLTSAGTLIALPHLGSSPPRAGEPSGSPLPPPSGTRVFVGRGKELGRLTSPAGHRLLVVSGMPGVGKTELAVRAVHELAAHYPDGIFWLELRTYAATESRRTGTEALRTLLNALKVPPDPAAAGLAELARAWRTATAGRRLLIVLDDADSTEQVRPLLPGGDSCAVIVTTRHVLVGLDPDHILTLNPFTRSQATRLAGAILRRAGLNDPRAAADIAAAFRLPLAIRQMSDLRVADPAQRVADRATSDKRDQDETAAAFARSLAALAPAVRLVLCRTAHYPGSLITAPIGAALTGRRAEETAAHLATLYQRGLLIPDTRIGGYRMHDAVRAAALTESARRDTIKRLEAAEERLFQYISCAVEAASFALYRSLSVTGKKKRQADLLVPQYDSDIAALHWIDQHHADLLAVVRRALSIPIPGAWGLVYHLSLYQRMRGFYAEVVDLNSHALKLAEHAGDRLGQAAMQQNLGMIAKRTSDYRAALGHLATALSLYTEVGNRTGHIEVNNELCVIYQWFGDLTRARTHATRSLEAATAGGDLIEQAFTHTHLGILDRKEGKHASARDHLTRSMTLFERAGQRRGVAICRCELGILDEDLGRHQDARTHLAQALSLFEDLADLMNQANTHYNLAVVHRHLGDTATAHGHATTALTLSRQISHIQGQADTHEELALLSDDEPTAQAHLTEAQALRDRLRQRNAAL
ncbi:tetratricopeptide repeat protein [Nonomuraea sp. NPDC002799]